MKQTKIRRRGSVLVYTLFILGFLLIGALSMALVMLAQERSSSDIQQSIQAFQYVNTGVEMAVSVSRNKAADIESINDLASEIGHATCSNGVITVDPGGPYTYEIRFLDEVSGNLVYMGNCADNLEDAEEVRSAGTFKGATRAIQVPYDFCGGPSSIPISTCSDLEDIASGWAGHAANNYCLARDIDCGGYGGLNGFTPIPTFTGTLDGMRNKIFDLSIRITSNSRDHIGLFEELGVGSFVQRLTFEDAQIDVDNSGLGSDIHIGTLAGCLNGGTVEDVSVSSGTVDVDVRRNSYTGGLIGKVDGGGSVHFSHASNDVSVVNNDNSVSNHAAGGLVGRIPDGLLGKSFATGAVSVTGGSSSRIAGLVGVLDTSATVTNCYSTGAITNGDDGLVGESSSGATVSGSYWDINTSGKNSSAEGDGRTTAQMKRASTYTGWDFVDIWQIDETQSYPCFNWQGNVAKCPI